MNCTAAFLLVLSLIAGFMHAQEQPSTAFKREYYQSKREYAGLGVTEVVLKNGMKVLLKPTNEDDDDIQIRLFANGGHSSFQHADNTVAEAAVATGWECGFGDRTVDQQSVFIYENSIEFSPKIEAHYRMIEGSVPKDSLNDYLQLVQVYFSEQNFCEKEFDRVLKIKKALNKEVASQASAKLKNVFSSTDSPADNYATSKDIFLIAKDLFQKSFSNPSEFVCVIVGDFSPEKIERSLNKYLGKISVPTTTFDWQQPKPFALSSNTVHKAVHAHDRNECIVRMTFPLDKVMKPETMPIFKLACKVVEKRLNSMEATGLLSVNVHDELPSYPSMEAAWMIIQFRCSCKAADGLISKVSEQLNRMYQEGPLPAEVEEQVRIHKTNQSMWINSNEYWLSSLTSYALWAAPLELILDNSLEEKIVFDEIRDFLQRSVRSDRYTTVSLIP